LYRVFHSNRETVASPLPLMLELEQGRSAPQRLRQSHPPDPRGAKVTDYTPEQQRVYERTRDMLIGHGVRAEMAEQTAHGRAMGFEIPSPKQINGTDRGANVSVRGIHLDGRQMGGDDRGMDATGTCPRLRSWTQQHDRSLGMRTAAGISAIR
jgi:hypothetical protein